MVQFESTPVQSICDALKSLPLPLLFLFQTRPEPLLVHKELHEKVALTDEHFQRWLEMFTATTDGMFAGERADFLKMRARAIAARMQEFLLG